MPDGNEARGFHVPLRIVQVACALCIVLASQLGVARAQDDSAKGNDGRILIRAKHVHIGDGKVLSPGEVLVTWGKISYVGESIELSSPARVVEVDSIMPGVVNASSNAGVSGGQAEVSREMTPDFDTLSAIDWRDRDFAEVLDQGVTTLQILPDTDSVFCGYACIVKSAGSAGKRLVRDKHGVLVAICSDPVSRNRSRTRPDSIYVRQPTNRMGVVWIVRNALHQAGQGEDAIGIAPDTREILSGITAGKIPVLSVSRTDFDMRSALELGDEYGFLPTIYGGDEIYRMVEEFKATKAPLVYTALTANRSTSALRGAEGTDLRWNIPGQLQQAGIQFCLAGDNLLEQARFAVRYGLPQSVAVKAVTLAPATILGIEDQVGSLAVGKQADVVALNGDPLRPTSAIQWTMVGGKIYGNNESDQ